MRLRPRDLVLPESTELNLPARKVRLVLPEALRVPKVLPYLRSSIENVRFVQNAYFLGIIYLTPVAASAKISAKC